MKKIVLGVVSFIILAASLAPLAVHAEYIPNSANDYDDCNTHVWVRYYTAEPTYSDLLACRADVAKQINAGRGYSTQVFFLQPLYLDPENFSLLSWVSFAVNVFFWGLFLYWTFLIIKSAFNIITSAGNPDVIAKATAQIKAVFTSLAAMFIFILILIFAGNFFGIGSIWEWPNSFRQCSNYNNKFYFTVRLELQGQPFDCN